MSKTKENENTEPHWLDWCRLCANEDAAINVRQKDVYMRLISKCFDVEIEFEEPQLGGMLCNDCFAIIGEFIHFTECVNKAQPIFELLRHSEPNEQLDVPTLRHEYGLESKEIYKLEPIEEDSLEGSFDYESQSWLDDSYSLSDVPLSPIPTEPKRKRGRPKGSVKKKKANQKGALKEQPEPVSPKSEHKEDQVSVEWAEEPSDAYEEGLVEEVVESGWLDDSSVEDDEKSKQNVEGDEKAKQNSIKNKRGRPKKHNKSETLGESAASLDKRDLLSPTLDRKSSKEPESLKLDQLANSPNKEDSEKDNIVAPNKNEFRGVKRKRGRPKKLETYEKEANISKCKNTALAKLLLADSSEAEPESESPVTVSSDDYQSQKKNQPVNCGICNKELASENGLKVHIDNVHNKKKPYVCDICGKGVPTGSSLKEHMLVHTEERPFVCPVCNAGFKNQKRLNIHSQTHGAPSYECNICGKKLQTRAIWNKHKYVHNNVRRFECRICGTTCKHSTALKVHLLSHTGFRPYACKYCNKAFASGSNCRDHKLKHHPVEYAKDDDKSSRVESVPTLDELRAIAEKMEKCERLRRPRKMSSPIKGRLMLPKK